MLKDSSEVVVAQIQEKLPIVSYEKTRVALRPVKEGDKTMVPLFGGPDIGYLFRAKILETIKPKNSQENTEFSPGAVIGIFSRYNCATDVPCLFKGKKYLLFLRPFDANDYQLKGLQFNDAALYQGPSTLQHKIPFDPKDSLMFARALEPAIELTSENTKNFSMKSERPQRKRSNQLGQRASQALAGLSSDVIIGLVMSG
jgi:hypothetical protein